MDRTKDKASQTKTDEKGKKDEKLQTPMLTQTKGIPCRDT
jgi:hypothetical protein